LASPLLLMATLPSTPSERPSIALLPLKLIAVELPELSMVMAAPSVPLSAWMPVA
jgi:hypothetical protein